MQNFSVGFVPSPDLDEETKRTLVLAFENMVVSVDGQMLEILRGLATTQRIQQEECCWPDEQYH